MTMKELTLLKTRRFLPLFVTQFLSAFNDNIFKNALAILITYRISTLAPSANAQMLVVAAAGIFILPFFLFSVTAGEIADRFEKSRLIVIIKSIEIVLMSLAAYGFFTQNIMVLMVALFALGTHSTFFGPLKYAILPDHLKADELIAGNGLIEAGTFLSILLGTILGSLFILFPHGEWIISGMIIITACCGLLASCYIPRAPHATSNIKISRNIFKETLRLINHAKQNSTIFLSILGISWFWAFGSIFLLEFPVFAKDALHANEKVVTLFLTLFSLGLGAGSLLCNRLLKGKIHATYVPIGVLGMTIFTIDLYFAAKHPMTQIGLVNLFQFLLSAQGLHISLDLIFIAICGGIYTVPLYALLQQCSEQTHRARTIASNNVINALFMVFASFAAMIMIKLDFSVMQIFLTIGILNGMVAIYICKLLPTVFIKTFFRSLLSIFYRVSVKGLENYHQAGERVIIIANHTSFLDALLLAVFLPDQLTFAINTFTAKKWWVKPFLRLVNAYPIDPTNPMGLKSLIDLVEKDTRCVIFPEGRLTVTGSLMKVYEGPGLIAHKSGAAILPVHIQGAQLTHFSRLRGKIRLRFFPKITLTIFPPQTLTIAPTLKGKKRRQEISQQLYQLMTEMTFKSGNLQQTLFESLLDAKSMQRFHHPIIEDVERKPMTYFQLITRSFMLGNQIAKNTNAHEHVGLLLPNMASQVITFFALQAFSRVPAMLNYSSGIQQVILACRAAQIKTIYTSHQFITLAKLNELVIALKNENIQIVYLETIRKEMTIVDKLKGLCMGILPRFSYRFINRNTGNLNSQHKSVILFTSGSEGTPKGVVLSHQNIQANRYQLAACIDFNTHDIIFNALPLFHSFGLTAGLLLPILSGIKTFLYPSPLHYRLIPELTYDTNATILFGTDTFLAAYAKHAHAFDFHSVRYVFAGAEKLRDETRLVWSQKFGLRILEGYGATETSPVISINTPMQHKVGTVGRLLPGIRYQFHPVPGIDEGGALSVAGPNIMKGYLLVDQPGVLISYEDKWYDTGDVVSIDDTGYLTIKGRVKRFAKIAGEMVSLTMVEQQISQLWPTHQHAIISMPDDKKGEQLILITTNPQATRDSLVSLTKNNQLNEISIPKKIKILSKLPLLGTGKIDYISIKDLLLNSI